MARQVLLRSSSASGGAAAEPCHAALRPEERYGDLWMEIDPEEVGGRSGGDRQSQWPFGSSTTTDTSTPGPSVSSDP
jgi:hypothetical protein